MKFYRVWIPGYGIMDAGFRQKRLAQERVRLYRRMGFPAYRETYRVHRIAYL